jgi:hypothetical protein
MEFFGFLGFIFAVFVYYRIDKLEKQLKKTGVLDQDFTSE